MQRSNRPGRGGARDGAGRPLLALDKRKQRSGKVPVWLSPHAVLQLIELQSAHGFGGDSLVETLIAEAHTAMMTERIKGA